MNKERIVCALVLALMGLAFAGFLTGCPKPPSLIEQITEKFDTSLHGTRVGKQTWYEGTTEQPGFYSLTNIPYNELACHDCHASTFADGTPVDAATYVPGCADCHTDGANPSAANVGTVPNVCLGCHSRQGAEIGLSGSANPTIAARFSDVHRTAGMNCTDCHSQDEMHGNGMTYASIAESPSVSCEDCHNETDGTLPDPAPTEHTMHMANIDCAACHVQTVVSCYNCHFETEVVEDVKRFFGPPPLNGFVFLVNNVEKGKVSTASFQSLTYGENKFVAFGPFYGHTVSAQGRTCGDCHNNANVQEYNDTGEIRIASWDEDTHTVTGPSGVVPVPEDFATSYKFDFLSYTPDDLGPTDPAFQPELWTLLPGDADLMQMLEAYATPLTSTQMQKLAIPVGSK